MTEANTNPYDPDEFSSGGQKWDDQVVQIVKAEFKVDFFKSGKRGSPEEKPWIDPKTKKQGFGNVLAITGIGVDDEREWTETYGTGAFIPTEDGEQCVHPKDPSKRLNEKSGTAIFMGHLKNAGFDNSTLYPKISALAGARILFKGYPVYLPDGGIKQKNGYDVIDYYPNGIEEGGTAAVAQTVTAGNGLAELADETVLEILGNAKDGKLTRAALVKEVSKALAGKPESNKVVALVVRADYHVDKPWTYSGTGISL